MEHIKLEKLPSACLYCSSKSNMSINNKKVSISMINVNYVYIFVLHIIVTLEIDCYLMKRFKHLCIINHSKGL